MTDTRLTDFTTDTPQPAITLAYDPDGNTCAQCETTVTRLWHADGTTYCHTCRPWTIEPDS